MNLKQALLGALEAEQLKELCAELEIEADRRSGEAMVAALSGAKRAKPEAIIVKMTVPQLRAVLVELEQPARGNKEELVERLLQTGGRGAASSTATTLSAATPISASDLASEYRHSDRAVQRPDAGVQDQFQAKRPPKVYRYDSSLDPALSWDEQRERDVGEWLLGLIVRVAKEGEATVFAEPQVWKGGGVRVKGVVEAAHMLQQIGRPILNWAGKAERQEIRVATVPLFVHERHSTRAVLDGIRHRKARGQTLDLFGDAGMDIRENLEAYEHKGPWQNRMILGDSLAVMNSLVEFEGLGGQVQMIYIDPPYGVNFGSNFQPFVRNRIVPLANRDEDMTREPEMVKAYQDTWQLGLHSYLTYIRDRLLLARELLSKSGSIFVQISDDNLHHVREVLDEVFGSDNFVSVIAVSKTSGASSPRARTLTLSTTTDFIVWYARDATQIKYKQLFRAKDSGKSFADVFRHVELADGTRRPITAEEAKSGVLPDGARLFALGDVTSQNDNQMYSFEFEGKTYSPKKRGWRTTKEGMERLAAARRLVPVGDGLRFVQYAQDFPVSSINNLWDDTGTGSFLEEKLYVVQTAVKVVQRCILMTTDPGDLVLDPTCGSGTTAYAAEQWGRRWITIDTSRVPLALARQRILTSTFPYYKLKTPTAGPAGGFVYERRQTRKREEVGGLVPHITLRSIANAESPVMEVLVDRPEVATGVTRVAGPFVIEAMIPPVQPLGTADGDPIAADDVSTHIQRMTELLRQSKTLHLPGNRELAVTGVRRTAGTEYVHAEATESNKRVAIVFGPADGAVSTTLVYEAGREAHYLKYDQLYFFGFAIEPGARAMIEDEKKLRIPAAYVSVTPDVAMSDLLKTTRASEIFSVTGLPDVKVRRAKKKGADGQPLYEAELEGLDLFDPESIETDSVNGENVPCWMLDTDYDGLCFYAAQVFFPKTSAWDNLQRSLKTKFDDSVWSHLAGTISEPFALGERRRVAVKVIDERGNELMRVLDVAE
ncbi:DNA methyltransferase [Bradyrhizobium sp. SZCCHNRI1058]|uniref:DNA methyltransferase n=1 Tax=Bradyrhizobium sp. SZCCHNRI1058 TaxID=3057279 RepID=UPI00291635B2|nr:DNA methyltransferase [Bradyrhizobium sp. SZCCHNRI1058]